MKAHRIVIILLSSALTALLLGIYLPTKAHSQSVCHSYLGGVTVCDNANGVTSEVRQYLGGVSSYRDSSGNSAQVRGYSAGVTTVTPITTGSGLGGTPAAGAYVPSILGPNLGGGRTQTEIDYDRSWGR
jgi:hypothetical protein